MDVRFIDLNLEKEEDELFANAKKHGVEVHGYTEEAWREEVEANKEYFRKLIKQS
jgi:hypothetical protein